MNKSKLRENSIEDMVDTVFTDWVNSGSELNGKEYLKKRLREALAQNRKAILEEVEEYFGHILNDGNGKPIMISTAEVADDVTAIIKGQKLSLLEGGNKQ